MRRPEVKIPEHFLSQYKHAQERLMLRGMAPAPAGGGGEFELLLLAVIERGAVFKALADLGTVEEFVPAADDFRIVP